MTEQKHFDFGTSPHELYRKNSLDTSVEAANSLDTTKLESMVYKEIVSYGEEGCIADQILDKYNDYPYSSITARFAALHRKGYIVRDGEKRQGKSGRKQSVMRAVNETSR